MMKIKFHWMKWKQTGNYLKIEAQLWHGATVFSILLATVLSPIIANLALKLGPWEYFSLCFCAITLIASLSKGSIFKGLMAAGIGLLMGCVGSDPINGIL